jgi:uncharacterized membrane protein
MEESMRIRLLSLGLGQEGRTPIEALQRLKKYIEEGGKLLLSGYVSSAEGLF